MSEEATQQPQLAGGAFGQGFQLGPLTITLMDVMYFGLLIFFLYQAIKTFRMQRQMKDPKYVYDSKPRTLHVIVMIFISVFGILTMVIQKQYLTGAIMILLGIMFLLSSRNKVIVNADGVFADGRYYEWKKVRKWGWDTKGGNLVLITKEHGKPEEKQVLQVGRVGMTEINERIRQFKLGKTHAQEEPAEEAAAVETPAEAAPVSTAETLAQNEKAEPAQTRTGLKGTGKSAGKKRKKK